jgi:hypothetical protein
MNLCLLISLKTYEFIPKNSTDEIKGVTFTFMDYRPENTSEFRGYNLISYTYRSNDPSKVMSNYTLENLPCPVLLKLRMPQKSSGKVQLLDVVPVLNLFQPSD